MSNELNSGSANRQQGTNKRHLRHVKETSHRRPMRSLFLLLQKPDNVLSYGRSR